MTDTPLAIYKVLNADGFACHGGKGSWHLPNGKRPGKWMPEVKHIKPCERGYHLCEGTGDLVHWLGPVIYGAAWKGKRIRHEDKIVVSEARLVSKCAHWTEHTARLFAASCARDVLPIFEKERPNDDRVRKCIEAVEAFARGEVDRVVLNAAGAAARAAAGDAARAAARAKQARRLDHLLTTGEILLDV